MIGECLIETLGGRLDQDPNTKFTEAQKKSWLKLYDYIQEQIKCGLDQAEEESKLYANS